MVYHLTQRTNRHPHASSIKSRRWWRCRSCRSLTLWLFVGECSKIDVKRKRKQFQGFNKANLRRWFRGVKPSSCPCLATRVKADALHSMKYHCVLRLPKPPGSAVRIGVLDASVDQAESAEAGRCAAAEDDAPVSSSLPSLAFRRRSLASEQSRRARVLGSLQLCKVAIARTARPLRCSWLMVCTGIYALSDSARGIQHTAPTYLSSSIPKR